jgi:hypothetical protein
MFTDEDLKLLKERCKQNGTAFEVDDYLLEALIARLEAAENCFDSLGHEYDCILCQGEAVEPTPDGGYRMRYAGRWYHTKPICDCGLDKKLGDWRKAAGK